MRKKDLRRAFERAFPEPREILIRADGKVRYLAVSRRAQVASALALAGFVLWSAVATERAIELPFAIRSHDAEYTALAAERDSIIASAQASRDQLLEALDHYRREIETLTTSLDDNRAKASKLAEPNRQLSAQLTELGSRLEATEAERERVEQAQFATQGRLADAEAKLRELAATKVTLQERLTAVQTELNSAAADRGRLLTERVELEEQLLALKQEVGTITDAKDSLEEELEATETQLRSVKVDRDQIDQERSVMQTRLEELTLEMSDLEGSRTVLEASLRQVAGQLQRALYERSRIAGERRRMEARLSQLASEREELVRSREALESSLNIVGAELSGVLDERDDIAQERARMRGQLSALQTEVKELEESRAALRDRLNVAAQNLWRVAEDRSHVMYEREHAAAELSVLKENVTELSASREALVAELGAIEVRLSEVVQDRGRVTRDRDRLAERAASLEQRLAGFEDGQSQLIEWLVERTVESLEQVQPALRMTGLDLERLIERAGGGAPVGQGGPFVPVARDIEVGSVLAQQLASLDERLGRWKGIERVLEHLPLAAPLDGYHVSSRFGRRRDPIRGGMAMHHGLDFVSSPGSAVYTTAPGRVTFVGWKGGFGKMVEVDHGLGIRTRYGHLEKIFVKHGQVVGFRKKIGRVGNTGRSTGPHLHYEILMDGRPQDPLNFLRAGQHVFKG
ncbi:MAG: peptidoglycan DD-metalloendopeptidase family protein [Alphaproteobacteria bacterium]